MRNSRSSVSPSKSSIISANSNSLANNFWFLNCVTILCRKEGNSVLSSKINQNKLCRNIRCFKNTFDCSKIGQNGEAAKSGLFCSKKTPKTFFRFLTIRKFWLILQLSEQLIFLISKSIIFSILNNTNLTKTLLSSSGTLCSSSKSFNSAKRTLNSSKTDSENTESELLRQFCFVCKTSMAGPKFPDLFFLAR